MAKGSDAGSTFLTGVLARLSPEDRQKGEELLSQISALGGGRVVTDIGSGVLAQDEFTRQMNELKSQQDAVEAEQARIAEVTAQQQTTHQAQVEWFERKKADLEELRLMRAAGGNGNGNGHGNPDPKGAKMPEGVITQEQLDAALQARDLAFLGFSQDKDELMRDHFRTFGVIPDFSPLLQHPQIRELKLKGVYQLVYKDQLEAHAKAEKDKAEAAIRADERAKVQASLATMPYPQMGDMPFEGGSPLDALTGKTDVVVDGATQMYQNILRERAAGRA